jgi:hypothetical protein
VELPSGPIIWKNNLSRVALVLELKSGILPFNQGSVNLLRIIPNDPLQLFDSYSKPSAFDDLSSTEKTIHSLQLKRSSIFLLLA